MNPADAQLIALIQQVTQGSSRLLVTLARRGKALERDNPKRAAFLLEAVVIHPLYKGGRLTFDMLEIEDLMLDGPPVDPMSTREVIQLVGAGFDHFAGTLKRMGFPAQGARMPAKASTHDTDVLDESVRARTQGAGELVQATPLPRLSLGPKDDVPRTTNASTAPDDGRDTRDSEPELRSSDYLYDYVVLGLLDVAGGIRMT